MECCCKTIFGLCIEKRETTLISSVVSVLFSIDLDIDVFISDLASLSEPADPMIKEVLKQISLLGKKRYIFLLNNHSQRSILHFIKDRSI